MITISFPLILKMCQRKMSSCNWTLSSCGILSSNDHKTRSHVYIFKRMSFFCLSSLLLPPLPFFSFLASFPFFLSAFLKCKLVLTQFIRKWYLTPTGTAWTLISLACWIPKLRSYNCSNFLPFLSRNLNDQDVVK